MDDHRQTDQLMPLPFHEVASIFPLMDGAEFEALKADLAANGQQEPIWLHEGKVVDGRNRARALDELGTAPTTREWDGRGSLVTFVVSLNLHRRHLSSSQRSVVAHRITPLLEAEAKERQRAAGRRVGGDQRSAKSRTRVPDQLVAIVPQVDSVDEKVPPSTANAKTREAAARLTGTSARYVQDAKSIDQRRPELLDKVLAGELTLPQAKRMVDREDRKRDLETRAAAVPASAARPWDLIHGDTPSVLSRLAEEGRKFRLIFADPPYNEGIDYGSGEKADRKTPEAFVDWSGRWIDRCAELLTADGSMWVLISEDWADHFGILMRNAGLHRRRWVVWHETFGVNCPGNFGRCARHLFYAVKDARHFVFNEQAVRIPSDRQTKYGDKRADPGGKIMENVWDDIPRLVDNAAERVPGFPTQLPLALPSRIISCCSDPGDAVLDPFNGSGTTGEACVRLGRHYTGIDLQPGNIETTELRLRAAGAVERKAS